MKSYFSLLFLLISISTAISQSRMNIQFGIGYELLPDRILKYQRTYSEYFYHTDTTELVKEYTAQLYICIFSNSTLYLSIDETVYRI